MNSSVSPSYKYVSKLGFEILFQKIVNTLSDNFSAVVQNALLSVGFRYSLLEKILGKEFAGSVIPARKLK